MISAEDLIVTKILAGRPKDIEDIRSVMTAQTGRLIIDVVRRTLKMLEEALGVSDLVPALESLHAGG